MDENKKTRLILDRTDWEHILIPLRNWIRDAREEGYQITEKKGEEVLSLIEIAQKQSKNERFSIMVASYHVLQIHDVLTDYVVYKKQGEINIYKPIALKIENVYDKHFSKEKSLGIAERTYKWPDF